MAPFSNHCKCSNPLHLCVATVLKFIIFCTFFLTVNTRYTRKEEERESFTWMEPRSSCREMETAATRQCVGRSCDPRCAITIHIKLGFTLSQFIAISVQVSQSSYVYILIIQGLYAGRVCRRQKL